MKGLVAREHVEERLPVEVWCRHNRGWLSDDGVVHIVAGSGLPSPDYAYTGQDAEAALALGTFLARGRPRLVIGDMRNVRRAETAARRVRPSQLVSALAILIESPVTRMLANAYLGITRPDQPTKVFNDIESARRWLSGLERDAGTA